MASRRDRATNTSRRAGNSAGKGLPYSSSARRYTSTCRTIVSIRLCGFTYQQSPSRAARRIAGSALAPIQIGGGGFCNGRGGGGGALGVKWEGARAAGSWGRGGGDAAG